MLGFSINRAIRDNHTVTIAINTTSISFLLEGGAWGSVQLPSAITGTSMEVKYSNDGSTFTRVPVEGNEANPLTVAASGTYALPTKTFAAKYCQLVMDSQAAARIIKLFFRG